MFYSALSKAFSFVNKQHFLKRNTKLVLIDALDVHFYLMFYGTVEAIESNR